MKNVWFGWISALLVGMPLMSAVYQAAVEGSFVPPRWIWRLNAVPMPFVLASPTYLRTSKLEVTFTDGTRETFDQPGGIVKSRFDRTVTMHLLRTIENIPEDKVRLVLRRAFCRFSKDNKRIANFGISVFSTNSVPIFQDRLTCP